MAKIYNRDVVINGKLTLAPTSTTAAADAASGLIMGKGTTAAPLTTATANANFIEFRTRSTATSGTSRGFYWRHNLTGAGQSGECVRAFTKVEAACTTVRGSQISLDLGTGGSCSGLGVGVDAQLMLANAALTGGTYAALNGEVYCSGSSTTVSGATRVSLLRLVASGDGTGVGDFDDNGYAIELAGLTAGSGNIIDTGKTTWNKYGGLKIYIPGVGSKWLAITSD